MDNQKDKRLFQELAVYSKHLAELHLMQSSELDSPAAKFQRTGDKRVDKIKYDKNGKCIYINKEQYFEGVENTIREYRMGDYQVLSKWLKDRKGKILSFDVIKHYCKIVTAIKETIGIQKSIDKIYKEAEKNNRVLKSLSRKGYNIWKQRDMFIGKIRYINTGAWTEFPVFYLQATGDELYLRTIDESSCKYAFESPSISNMECKTLPWILKN